MNGSSLAAAALAVFAGGLVAAPSPANAADIYLLEDGLYAIICEDGHIFSYEGSEGGLSTVVPALCENHGGVVGGGGDGGIRPVAASADLERVMERCSRRARPVAGVRSASSCPTQMRSRTRETAPARAAE